MCVNKMYHFVLPMIIKEWLLFLILLDIVKHGHILVVTFVINYVYSN